MGGLLMYINPVILSVSFAITTVIVTFLLGGFAGYIYGFGRGLMLFGSDPDDDPEDEFPTEEELEELEALGAKLRKEHEAEKAAKKPKLREVA